MRSELFDQANQENATAERFSLHHRKTLRAVLGEPVLAAKGSMVAFQGQVTFEHKSAGSIGKMMRRLVTSEDTPLMTVAGQGEVFFADAAKDVFLVQLEDDGLSVNGSALLAMDASLDYDVHRVKGAGMMSGANSWRSRRGPLKSTSLVRPQARRLAWPRDDAGATVPWKIRGARVTARRTGTGGSACAATSGVLAAVLS